MFGGILAGAMYSLLGRLVLYGPTGPELAPAGNGAGGMPLNIYPADNVSAPLLEHLAFAVSIARQIARASSRIELTYVWRWSRIVKRVRTYVRLHFGHSITRRCRRCGFSHQRVVQIKGIDQIGA